MGGGPVQSAAPAAGDAQDTPQALAAAAVWDLCASHSAAAFMVDNQLLDLAAALLQRHSGAADGVCCQSPAWCPYAWRGSAEVTMDFTSGRRHTSLCSHRLTAVHLITHSGLTQGQLFGIDLKVLMCTF